MRNGVRGPPVTLLAAMVIKSAQGHVVIRAQQQRQGRVSWNHALVRVLPIAEQLNIMLFFHLFS